MTTKIDLGGLERKARRVAATGHGKAASPAEILALVERIGELESGLRRLTVRGTPQATWIRALLDKGAVLP
jgi:hypothetical protein